MPFWVIVVALFGTVTIAIFTPMPWQLWWDVCSLALAVWLALRIADRFILQRQGKP